MRSTLIPAALILIFAAQLPSQQSSHASRWTTPNRCNRSSIPARLVTSALPPPPGLHLDTAAGALAGSNSGRVIIPGNSKEQLAGAAHLRHHRQSDAAQRHAHQGADQADHATGWIKARSPMHRRARGSRWSRKVFPPAVSTIASAAMEQNYFQAYCVTCHSGPYAKAGLELDKLDTAHVEKDAEKWEKVVRMLRSGMMPPAGMPRPDAKTYEAMTVWMENELDRHKVAQLPPPGLHRLNRAEYANADSRPAGRGSRSRQVPALRRFNARLRQHRRRADAFAGAARRLHVGRGQDQPPGGRATSTRPSQTTLPRPRRHLAGLSH